jgi:hypothetical protein
MLAPSGAWRAAGATLVCVDPNVLVTMAFPVLLTVGGIAAWRVSKRDRDRSEAPAAWRDDSLDDWRRERDANAEAHRTERATNPEETTGRGDEQAETKKHQRIGG